MGDIEEPPHDWNCLTKRNMTYDKRFGELIQQNDNSGKNNQFDIFIFQHIFASKGSEVLGSGFCVQGFRAQASGCWQPQRAALL
jgi:hypothetical protein